MAQRTAEKQGGILAENLYELVDKERNELYVKHFFCDVLCNKGSYPEHGRLRALCRLALELNIYLEENELY